MHFIILHKTVVSDRLSTTENQIIFRTRMDHNVREALRTRSKGRRFNRDLVFVFVHRVLVIKMLLKKIHVICSRLRGQLMKLLS